MKLKGFIALAIFAMLTLSGFAQEKVKKFGVELNGGPTYALHELGGADLHFGLGYEVIFQYSFTKHIGIYTGWGYTNFSAKDSSTSPFDCFDETGYVLGLQFQHPIGSNPISFFVRGGGLVNHLEVEDENGDLIVDTKHGLGWQLAGGVEIPLGSNWSITPGVKFNSLSRTSETEDSTIKFDLDYLSIRLGIIKRF